MEPGSGAAWTAGQVARHLGIAESTLRSWHRRYGIGPHGREPGRYRRYREADVARLRRMLELIKQGMLASDAARTVEAGEPEAVSAERDVADLIAAATASDSERCRVVLDNVMTRRGVMGAWELVCRPALAIVDAAQRDDPDCMDIEHALSWAILGALHRVPRPPIAPGTDLVLLACVEAEHHTLPLAALAAALATYRVPVRMLGAATPTQSLVRAVRDTHPAAVVLWSQRPDTAGLPVLQALRPHPVRLLTAGPGWPSAAYDSVTHLTGLSHALTVLVGAPAGPGHPGAPAEAGHPDFPPPRPGPPTADPGPGLGADPGPGPGADPGPGPGAQPGPGPQRTGPQEPGQPGSSGPQSSRPDQGQCAATPGSPTRRYPPFPTDVSAPLQ